jgi:cytochrome c
MYTVEAVEGRKAYNNGGGMESMEWYQTYVVDNIPLTPFQPFL